MDAKKIIESVQLPTLSKTLFEIIEVEKANPISFLDDIKKIVERDPLLSAHILKVANSPLYGFTQKVRTIAHGIGLLGVRKIRNIAFSFSIFDFMKKVEYKVTYGETFNLILKKSLLISAISSILAKKINYLNVEELNVSGLLTEIGEMILFLHAPEKYCKIYSVNDKLLMARERETFGTDHVDVGSFFCDKFNLPTFFKQAIIYHAELKNNEEHCKISYIATQIAQLLLLDDEEEKARIFKEIENHTKKLLHLSLSEIEETIKVLPGIMEAYTNDFPEMQKDLKRIIETGSSLIITLMKKEMDMVILTKELGDSQRKMAEEKMFLSHMLNLSYFFSSLMSPLRIISSLFEYFDNFISEFTIEFIYRDPGSDNYLLYRSKEHMDGEVVVVDRYPSLLKSKISNETVRLDKAEKTSMGQPESLQVLAFPISYHHNFFGFLMLNVEKESYLAVDMEMSYVQILANIIANSFQNYYSFEGLKNETSKKQLVTRELLKFDKQMSSSRENMIELQKSEILGELLPVIFHKLKNKLTPILGYAQILIAKVKDEDISRRIKKIEKNANDLAYQLNILRDYFKTETVIEEPDNINRVLQHLKPYFNKIKDEKNIAVELELERTIPDDMINPGHLEALITNIVDNAVEAVTAKNASDGRIIITTRREPDSNRYCLSIKDNGIGIKEETLPRIWTPFHSEFKQRPGIGLTVCERVINNHHATVTVESREGQFTEFKISFTPRLAQKESDLLEESLRPKSHLTGKILIVDDESYLLDLMKEILQSEGNFEILTAGSGKEALDLIDDGLDLVISDIRMPEVNGMDIYRFLKARQMEDRIIMVTADPYSEDVAKFLKENNIEYLKKPFELLKFKQHVHDKLA